MNILLITSEYVHPKLPPCGGIGVFMYQYAKILSIHGHQVTVIGYSDIQLFENHNKDGIKLKFYKTKLNVFDKFIEKVLHKLNLSRMLIPILAKDKIALAKNIKTYCYRNKIDIIEVADYLGHASYVEVDIPIVIRTHGSYRMLQRDVGFRKNLAFEYFEEKQLKNANAIISISNFSKHKFYDYFPNKLITYKIYNGIPVLGEDIIKDNSVIRVFYFGTFSWAKGTDRLIKIFNELEVNFKNIEFYIAGKTDEYYKNNVYNNLSKSLKQKINYLGFLNKENVEKVLSKVNVVLFPSRLESFSLAFLEAMKFKNVCICWNIPMFNEVIVDKQNGFIVKEVSEIIDVMKMLMDDSQLFYDIQNFASKTIINTFDENKILIKNIDVYKKIIKAYNKRLQNIQ